MTDIQEIVAKNFPDFRKSQQFMDKLIDCGQLLEVEKGTALLDSGQYVKVIPFLLNGLLKIYREDEDGNEILLYYINSGESCVVSITTSLKNEKGSIKALVEEDSQILAVPSKEFMSLLNEYELLHTFTYSLFLSKYNALIECVDSLAFTDKKGRLWRYLIQESEIKNSKSLKLTHKSIADDLATSREVISRLLYALQREGKIELSNKQITIL